MNRQTLDTVMHPVVISCLLVVVAQQQVAEPRTHAPSTWAEFYADVVQKYQVAQAADRQAVPLKATPIFEWSSIDGYHGAVFSWTESGRPTLVGTVFSFPLQSSKQRLAVHEFASFAEADLVVTAPGGSTWKPAAVKMLPLVPGAAAPPDTANRLKIQCRQLAKEFSAHMNRRGERWDLRLLPKPLIEYAPTSDDVLGGGLFAFVGYSTDPEILLLLESRRRAGEGPAWFFHPVRFSDKSLYLKFKDKPVWESLRAAHDANGPDTEDPQYRVLQSERLAPDLVEKLSASK